MEFGLPKTSSAHITGRVRDLLKFGLRGNETLDFRFWVVGVVASGVPGITVVNDSSRRVPVGNAQLVNDSLEDQGRVSGPSEIIIWVVCAGTGDDDTRVSAGRFAYVRKEFCFCNRTLRRNIVLDRLSTYRSNGQRAGKQRPQHIPGRNGARNGSGIRKAGKAL